MPILKTPLFVLGVELAGLNLALGSPDAPVLDKEGRHVVVFPELLGSVLDTGGNLEVAALLEAPQALESPVEYPGTLGLDGVFDLRVAFVLD